MTGEDKIRLRLLAEALGTSQAQVLTRAVRELWDRYARGELRDGANRIPIRTSSNKVVWVEVKP